jgi:MoaA/NifB/PqqE/SkfB family radical SAM enzyme
MDDRKFVAVRYIHNTHAAFSVDWYIGKRCNFDCTYCVDYLHDSISQHQPLSKLKQIVDIIYNRYGNNVHWSITGGEPTIIPWFHELAKYIYEKPLGVRELSITTNGSRTTEYFTEQLYPYLHNITLSMHFEHISHREDEYVEKIIALENWRNEWNATQKVIDPKFNMIESDVTGFRNKNLLARFMVYPGQFKRIQRMYTKLKDAGVEKIEFRYIRPCLGGANERMPTRMLSVGHNHDNDIVDSLKVTGTGKYLGTVIRDDGITDHQAPDDVIDSKSPDTVKIVQNEEEWYTKNEKERLEKWYAGEPKKFLKMYFEEDGKIVEDDYHYNQLNFERKNNFEGWTCWAGRVHMKITPSGDLYVGSCHLGGKLGNIFELGNSALPTGPLTCAKWRCTDNLDIRVPKALPGYEHLIKPYVTKPRILTTLKDWIKNTGHKTK